MSAQQSPSTSVQEHRDSAPSSIPCAVLTVSDTRTEATDTSGALIKHLLVERGHTVADYRIVSDEPDPIRAQLEKWSNRLDIAAILSNGGTGIARRDTTYDVVVAMLDKRLDGFGELFRALSYQDIGAAAMLSRAVAGVLNGRLVVVMPGSSNAVKLAMERLILPEIAHVVYELTK